MEPFFFYLLATIAILFSLAVIANRNPIASAMSLVVVFISLGGVFILLNAYFIGIIQVLVYGGAIMVLFLFIIMLLDIKKERNRKLNLLAFGGGLAVVIPFLIQLTAVLKKFQKGSEPAPPIALPQQSDIKSIAALLYSDYAIVIQIIAVLLLVATIGAVALSKKSSLKQ